MPHLDLDDDQRYRALKSRDRRFDGVFIVGVRTTGVYCRPSCPTPVQPLRKNVDFYPTTAAAQRAGLRACKRCRPDATPGSPEWNLRDDLVGQAMRHINVGFLDHGTVADLARLLGVTERHLRRVMIESVGAPPIAIARAQRAQTARTLIETTDMRFTDVAFAAGFASLRQFNDTVRAVFDSSPTELRRRFGRDGATNGSLTIRLPYRAPIASSYLLGWWKQRSVPGVAVVDGAVLRTALRLPNGSGIASVQFVDDHVSCHLELEAVADLAPAVARCRAMLDLDADPTHIDAVLRAVPAMRPFVRARPGLRSPGTSDGFATLVFAILGQQRSVAAARTLAGRIAARHRAPADGEALRPFPSASELIDTDYDGVGLTRRTEATLDAAAEMFAGRDGELDQTGDRVGLRAQLQSIVGIGPWTANYVAMRVLGDPDVFLAGDLVADRAAATIGLDEATIATASPWRSYLTHHLWAASASTKAKT